MSNGKQANFDRNDVFTGKRIFFVFLSVVAVAMLVGFVPWALFEMWPELKLPKDAPLLGDSFGFVNGVLSALALAGVLVTLWMQKTELRLQREEMQLTREEYTRMAQAQEDSERRLFLAAYINALEQLRQYGEWRMTRDPARTSIATFPVVEGLVIQNRVGRSLHTLVQELDPEIYEICPNLAHVSREGSQLWQLETFLNLYLELKQVERSFKTRSDDAEAFREADNIVRHRLQEIRKMKEYCDPAWHGAIGEVLTDEPNLDWIAGNIFDDSFQAKEARKQYFSRLQATSKKILSLIMSMSYE